MFNASLASILHLMSLKHALIWNPEIISRFKVNRPSTGIRRNINYIFIKYIFSEQKKYKSSSIIEGQINPEPKYKSGNISIFQMFQPLI